MARPDPSDDDPTIAALLRAETADTMVLGGGTIPPLDSPEVEASDVRYEHGELLGRGGMGDVRLCLDVRLGRSVAFKTMHTNADHTLRGRFLREARLQARLEHPSIVPVYDLGTAEDGSPFFTMRKLAGHTLERVIQELRAGRPEFVARYRRGRLLLDFVRVCEAIAYAHSRGVIHRDLKPANVIVAEFGEVYVLDWGVAKVRGEAEHSGCFERTKPGTTPPDATEAGSVLGTLGYMPPEQLEGTSRIDHRADIYTLGAILFELLTLEPLHASTSAAQLIESTMGGAEARASVRAPDQGIAPELEAICVRACAQDPAERYDDVRELVAALERYVDGDRDEQRRRTLADQHAERAQQALAQASTNVQARSRAAEEAGRALTFDPDHRGALAVLARLLLEPPKVAPPEVTRQLHEADIESSRSMARYGTYTRVIWFAFLGIILWMGVRNWILFGGLVVLLLFTIGGSFAHTADTDRGRIMRVRAGGSVPTIVVALNAAMLALLATAMGPFMIVPGLSAVSTAMFLLGGARNAPLVVALGCAPILLPFLAEQLGVLPMIEDPRVDALVLHPLLVSFPPLPTTVALVAMALATVFLGGLSVASARRRLVASREQQLLLAWHLGQVVPGASTTAR